MNRLHRLCKLGASVLVTATLFAAGAAHADFTSFVIRGNAAITNSPSQTQFVLANAGDKGGYGSSDIDGSTLGSISSLTLTRLDDATRFTAGSGQNRAPYLNFWITDGAGHFAVVANEPTNPEWNAIYAAASNSGGGYTLNLSFSDLADMTVKVYENSSLGWLPDNGVGLTFNDLKDFVIQAPTVAELTAGWSGLTGGAPRELGTNQAYGVNWVFGDTLANYQAGQPGYIVSDVSVQAEANAVPEPGSLALVGLALAAVAAAGRRKHAKAA